MLNCTCDDWRYWQQIIEQQKFCAIQAAGPQYTGPVIRFCPYCGKEFSRVTRLYQLDGNEWRQVIASCSKIERAFLMDCNHQWRRVHEESLLGGSFQIGWECINCHTYVSNSQVTPVGLGGTVLEKSARLVAPHGGRSRTSAGRPYKEQIIDESGALTIIE